jgi:cytochrome c553
MTRSRWLLALAAAAVAAGAGYLLLRSHAAAKTASASAYADSQSCIRCHGDEAAGYNKTGMAHAFYAPTADVTVASPAKNRVYFHKSSSM